MLEASLYSDNTFATLTYDDNILLTTTLDQKHYRDWLKRLRKAMEPHRFRFFIVGEYGDKSFRPHYHVALFNFPTCLRGRTLRNPGSTRPLWEKCCPSCQMVGRTWGYGDVDLGTLETASAQYVAGYVTKKMTNRQDPRLNGRDPEFARMSLKPGIGALAMHDVASTLLTFNLDETQGDVPSSLRHGNRLLPLGRYLRRYLRTLVGKDPKAPHATLLESEARLLHMLERYEKTPYDPLTAGFNVTARIKAASAQKILQHQAKVKIFKQRKENL